MAHLLYMSTRDSLKTSTLAASNKSKMSVIWYLVLFVISAVQIRGTNLMLNKPSVQSSTYIYSGVTYYASRANDGLKTGTPSITEYLKDPYWQGDLQGLYTKIRINVTSVTYGSWANELRNAAIGVSVNGTDNSEGGVIICGHWPDDFLQGDTIVFNCYHAGPVRFVRIWRPFSTSFNLGRSTLAITEVEVDGENGTLTEPEPMSCEKTMVSGTVYNKVIQQKVITPNTSLSVRSEIGCGVMCSQTQPCLAFSFSSSEQPNCLLATDVTMTSDMKWASYTVSPCF